MMRAPADSLAERIALVTASTVVITVVVTAAVSGGLVRSSARAGSQFALDQHADSVAALINTGLTRGVLVQPLEVLKPQVDTPAALVMSNGEVRGDPLAVAATAPHRAELVAGHPLSYGTVADGTEVLVSARPIRDGRVIVLARPTDLVNLLAWDLLERQAIALLVGLLVALTGGLLLARRLAAPLRRTATAAARLSAGDRTIRVQPEGPSEVAQVANSLNSLADALHTSESQQREFFLSISHELRTPLTAVRGFAEALADGVVAKDAVADTARTILVEANRLERLVNDLLDLARARATDFTLDVALVDLNAMMKDAAQVWTVRCAAAGVSLRAELSDAPIRAETDPMRLRQIIDGLMENALRVTPAEAPIVLALRTERGLPPRALLEVRDGGPGLTQDDLKVVFERSVLYQRYQGIRRVGTGLGLALAHALATRLDATFTAGTAPEGGVKFQIELPLRRSPGTPDPSEP